MISVKKLAVFIWGLIVIGWSASLQANANIKPFSADSLIAIEESRKGEAFILLLWSIECPPCLKELKLLKELTGQGLNKHLLLVSTDDMEYQTDIEALIANEALLEYEHWLFNGDLPERLRYNIDPGWYGELPRAYIYSARGQRVAHSGMLTKAMLEQWLALIHANSAPESTDSP
ncbi:MULTISPECIES: hypothetical protein [unclassified Oleiphilus]|jgi:thiol-disulfide isomerase/thioredoxin|uniref:hypothetical protein n=3 Tax=Oleiphilus TaxID=141450 RepID=UPI0007C36785|nr:MULTISPECIES: hypothetical protein [unclassified Oleiphilus]KZY75450.1 hypothetical protein A3740_15120 [Oleiphilus sp. HI0068]KZY80822.1 hypothetical protein A3741_18320 [Oleiphilus sp. HI0069]KZZ06767.1 hypothetical protein A3749_16555 [Oleiphilus sp. HI0078]KZZ28795.1 hypothetical protein A3752_20495 [Oleiphilus sp. HI0081]KZZ33863.1 hypothetical protein A3755_06975 [Oleiphilus sp. HI0085]